MLFSVHILRFNYLENNNTLKNFRHVFIAYMQFRFINNGYMEQFSSASIQAILVLNLELYQVNCV